MQEEVSSQQSEVSRQEKPTGFASLNAPLAGVIALLDHD